MFLIKAVSVCCVCVQMCFYAVYPQMAVSACYVHTHSGVCVCGMYMHRCVCMRTVCLVYMHVCGGAVCVSLHLHLSMYEQWCDGKGKVCVVGQCVLCLSVTVGGSVCLCMLSACIALCGIVCVCCAPHTCCVGQCIRDMFLALITHRLSAFPYLLKVPLVPSGHLLSKLFTSYLF